jgi:hypothetical protein
MCTSDDERKIKNEYHDQMYKERVHPCHDEIKLKMDRYEEDAKTNALQALEYEDKDMSQSLIYKQRAKEALVKANALEGVLAIYKKHFW